MSIEIDGIRLPDVISPEERPDDSFDENYRRYVSFQARHGHSQLLSLHEYADYQRRVHLPSNDFSAEWRERNPSFTMPDWERVMIQVEIELRKRAV
jgi:hypothetical protein